ncbi:MAG: hypothetical protein ACM3KE_05760 [Hyphomicrobiales bacterium]
MKPSDWKSVAWDRVRFAVPADWRPGRIGPRDLLLESEAGPVMEIKWGPMRGRFSKRRQLRRIARQAGRRAAIFRERPLSVEWREALGSVEAAGFEWDGKGQGASGVLVFCSVCRTASLIQFFHRNRGADVHERAAGVLASFRDHREDGRSAWALYDISANLPGHFHRQSHRFEAGRFVLEFRGPRSKLILYRWAPAAVLLKGRDLRAFAEAATGSMGVEIQEFAVGRYAGVEGFDPPPTGLAGRFKATLGMATFRGVRVWHVERRNRILGIRLEARQPIGAGEWREVCDGYGMDDEVEDKAACDPA